MAKTECSPVFSRIGRGNVRITGITITQPPDKTEYEAGDTFDPTGMEVTLVYSNGHTKALTGDQWSIVDPGSLTTDDTAVTVRYQGGGIVRTATQAITVTKINTYGAMWDGTETTLLTRTDDAADFDDPVPYVSGATSYGSPFDGLLPWSGMRIIEDDEAGTLVSIPKYWYKITAADGTLKIQIADGERDGFAVSPAHRDRGDGKGERDVVYVGRYHCGSTAYKSVTGQTPKASITRATARSAIAALGDTIWQMDYATWWTIATLYLVEFANWDSQATIGHGCGNGSSVEAMGASDEMPYHTGTMQTSRDTYGVGVQYRYIEGLWDNVFDWLDGMYWNDQDAYIILNPEEFSDTTGGTQVQSSRPTVAGFVSAWSVPTVEDYDWAWWASAVDGAAGTYISDRCSYSSDSTGVRAGGSYAYTTEEYGIFNVGGIIASNNWTNVGCRVQKLP